MKLTEVTFRDTDLQKLARAVATVLVNVSADNFRTIEIEGVTSSSANVATQFRHALGRVPSFWFPIGGRVYVPKDGLSENQIDIRSTVASEPFRILIVA